MVRKSEGGGTFGPYFQGGSVFIQGSSLEDSLSCLFCDDLGASGEEKAGQSSSAVRENQLYSDLRT